MTNNFWSELGLEPTADLRSIRHAYAARAKNCHPEEAPEEFQRLHDAYEAALSWAKRHPDGVPVQKDSDFPPPEAPPPAGPDPEDAELDRLIASGLQKEAQRKLTRYGRALGSLYHLSRSSHAIQYWRALLDSPDFSSLREEPEFYPFLQQFLSDHYETLPDAAWPALRDAFNLSADAVTPETEELYKLVLPRCKLLSQKENSPSRKQPKQAVSEAWLWALAALLVLILRNVEASPVFFLIPAALFLALLLVRIHRKRSPKSSRKR